VPAAGIREIDQREQITDARLGEPLAETYFLRADDCDDSPFWRLR
jgi:hypothetical protein